MNRSGTLRISLTLLSLIWLGHAAHAQTTQPSPSSADGSQPSATNARATDAKIAIGACAAAADELAATRRVADALDAENRALAARLETEKRTTHLLTELNETRRSETDALRAALVAREREASAKDAVIEKQGELIAALKQKRSSPWRRIGDVLIGAAAALIFK